jgi:acyl-CoA thioester hydrolase
MSVLPAPPCGQFEGPLHRYALRAYYEDTDATGRVYHGAYLRWFERARTDILELLGIDQRAAIETGQGFYVVADVTIRYRAPALLGDPVIIETTCEEARVASARMRQIAVQGGVNLCEAMVRVGFVGPDGKARAQPLEWRKAFAAIISNASDASDRERH